jgi:ribosomal protein L16/L10AE
MPIYLLESSANEDVAWDEYKAKIIRAENVKDARSIANRHIGKEGCIWDNVVRVKCTRIPTHGESEELMGLFISGA